MNDGSAASRYIGTAPARHIGTAAARHPEGTAAHAPATDPWAPTTHPSAPATDPWVGPDQWTPGDNRWVAAPARRGGAGRDGVGRREVGRGGAWRRRAGRGAARRGGALRTIALLTTLTVLGVSGAVITLRAGGVGLPLGGSAAVAGQGDGTGQGDGAGQGDRTGHGDGTGVVRRGAGTFTSATGGTKRVGAGTVLRYRVEVEDGLGQDPGEFAGWVDRVLADRRGWTAGGRWGFQRTASAPTDFVVRLASPDTVDEICGRYGLDTQGEVSCRGGENVVINVRRWLLGIPAFNGDVDMYRHAVVNHEVGHFLGHDHRDCPGEGEPAPVMQTMIYGMNGCRPNGWPFPGGAGDG